MGCTSQQLCKQFPRLLPPVALGQLAQWRQCFINVSAQRIEQSGRAWPWPAHLLSPHRSGLRQDPLEDLACLPLYLVS